MSKRYELLKDLPNINKGEIGVGNGFSSYEFKDKFGCKAFINSKVIESSKDWFKEVVEKKVQLMMEVFIRKGLHIQREQFTLPEGYVPSFKEGSTVYWWPDNLTFKQAANAEDCVLIWCNASTKESPPTPPTTLQDQDKFQYTEEGLRKAFEAAREIIKNSGGVLTVSACKYSSFKDYLPKQPTPSQPQNKERIGVVVERNIIGSMNIFLASDDVPREKFNAIKIYIESIINS